jgi:hypothetical protein
MSEEKPLQGVPAIIVIFGFLRTDTVALAFNWILGITLQMFGPDGSGVKFGGEVGVTMARAMLLCEKIPF